MTLAIDLAALDAILRHEAKLREGLPGLSRRARIPSRRDGFPSRASGAQPGAPTPPGEVFTTATCLVGGWWRWDCSCGTGNHVAQWASSMSALQAAAAHYEAQHSSTTSIDYADPTGEDATTARPASDPVARRHQRAVREVAKALRSMEVAVAQLTEPADVADNEPWCANCQRVRHPDGTPYLEPVYSKARGKTDVGKRLSEPQYLCRFDYDHVLVTGKLPPLEFTTERLTRGRAPRKAAS